MTWSWFWEHEMNACWWVFFWSLPVNPSNFTLHKSIILSQALLTRCNYSSWCVQTVSGRLSTNEKDVLLSLEQLFFSSIIFSLTQFHLGCLLKDFYNEKKKTNSWNLHIGSHDMSGLRMLWLHLISCRIEDMQIILSNGIYFSRGLSSLSSASS